jgi:hypothetical protein
MEEDVYATPAFVGEQIYVRGLTHLFCIGTDHGVEQPLRRRRFMLH